MPRCPMTGTSRPCPRSGTLASSRRRSPCRASRTRVRDGRSSETTSRAAPGRGRWSARGFAENAGRYERERCFSSNAGSSLRRPAVWRRTASPTSELRPLRALSPVKAKLLRCGLQRSRGASAYFGALVGRRAPDRRRIVGEPGRKLLSLRRGLERNPVDQPVETPARPGEYQWLATIDVEPVAQFREPSCQGLVFRL